MGIPPDTDMSDPGLRRDLLLSGLGFVGPSLWFSLLGLVYAVSDHECGKDTAWISVGLTSAGMLGALAAALALLSLRRTLHDALAAMPSLQAARIRLMLQLGLGLNGLSFVLLLGFMAPLLFLRPCE
ncbi:MAG: hypothetical protein JWN04_5847 [Myxococcaceae bacterium]|nr:hypothetical protein [Myxococcaceae bacterium]